MPRQVQVSFGYHWSEGNLYFICYAEPLGAIPFAIRTFGSWLKMLRPLDVMTYRILILDFVFEVIELILVLILGSHYEVNESVPIL